MPLCVLSVSVVYLLFSAYYAPFTGGVNTLAANSVLMIKSPPTLSPASLSLLTILPTVASSSTCSSTYHLRKLDVAWSFSLMARSSKSLIYLVTSCSCSSVFSNVSNGDVKSTGGPSIAVKITFPPLSSRKLYSFIA